MAFLLIVLLAIAGLAFWMWKRPDPVQRDQAKAVQHDLWLEQVDAQLKHAARLNSDPVQPNHQRAYELYQDLAKQYELPQAYIQMGLMYLNGQGRLKDSQNAISLLEKAFHLGSDEAAFHLGQFYEPKQGQQPDLDKALYWYRHAIARGNLDAQYRLQLISPDQGSGNTQQHLELLHKNADDGHVSSQYQLAQHYLADSPQQNLSLGIAYLFQAAEQGNLAANQQIFNHYRHGEILPQDRHRALKYMKCCIALGDQRYLKDYQQAVLMGDFDVDQRQRVFLELNEQAKVHKNPQAKALIGTAYFQGWYVERKETLGFRYWSEAAHDQSVDALCAIAALYFERYLVADEPEKAFELYRYAHRLEVNAFNLMGLALCYLSGVGTAQDTQKATQFIQQAALQGWNYKVENEADVDYVLGLFYALPSYPVSQRDQAFIYLNQAIAKGSKQAAWYSYQLYSGQIFEYLKDDAQAMQALHQAVALKHPLAEYTLGQAYLYGEGVEYNGALAVEYLKKSALQGNAAALNALGELYEQGIDDVIEADLTLALTYYQKAAAQVNADAYSHLGRLYLYGQGVERDLNVARDWLRKGHLMQHTASTERLQNIEDYFEQESKF